MEGFRCWSARSSSHPHIAHTLWSELGLPRAWAICGRAWPRWTPPRWPRTKIELMLQVNGKLRGSVLVPAGADKAEIERLAWPAPPLPSLHRVHRLGCHRGARAAGQRGDLSRWPWGRPFLAATVSAGCGCGSGPASNARFLFQTLGGHPEKNGLVAADLIRYFGKAIAHHAKPKGGARRRSSWMCCRKPRKDGGGRQFLRPGASSSCASAAVPGARARWTRDPGPDLALVQQRDISFNESAVLAKEAEENAAVSRHANCRFCVQQLLRRLAAIKSLD